MSRDVEFKDAELYVMYAENTHTINEYVDGLLLRNATGIHLEAELKNKQIMFSTQWGNWMCDCKSFLELDESLSS